MGFFSSSSSHLRVPHQVIAALVFTERGGRSFCWLKHGKGTHLPVALQFALICSQITWGQKQSLLARRKPNTEIYDAERCSCEIRLSYISIVSVRLLPWSPPEWECELMRGSVEDEPWPLALDSGPEELQSASLDCWRPDRTRQKHGGTISICEWI